MKNPTITICVVASLTLIAGCKKDQAGAGGGGKISAIKETKIAKLGITADLPADVNADSPSMMMGESIGAMSIDVATAKKTIDEGKSDADMFSPKDLKAEALSDGWVLTYNNKGAMGANYFLTVQRDIGGKTYRCVTTQPDNSRIDKVLAVCKSLRP